MFLRSLASNAYQWMSANVSGAERYFVKFNVSYLIAKSNLRIPAGPYWGGKHWRHLIRCHLQKSHVLSNLRNESCSFLSQNKSFAVFARVYSNNSCHSQVINVLFVVSGLYYRNIYFVYSIGRRVARIWKRGGGLFWKSEKCANDLDSNIHWSWTSFRRFVRKLRRNVSESSEIQSFFPPKIRWSPKKKKVFAKIQSDFPAEIRNSEFFSANDL